MGVNEPLKHKRLRRATALGGPNVLLRPSCPFVSQRDRGPSHIDYSGSSFSTFGTCHPRHFARGTFEILRASNLEQVEPPLPDMPKVADSRIAVTLASRSSCWSQATLRSADIQS